MKKLFSFILIFISVWAFAQAPEAINYQTVVRADDGTPSPYFPMDFKISILQGSSTGTVVYSEEHATSADANGMVSFKIGQGTIVSGEFASISWGAATHFLKIEARQTDMPNYNLMGVEEFSSVPYALFAKNTAASDNMWQQLDDDIY